MNIKLLKTKLVSYKQNFVFNGKHVLQITESAIVTMLAQGVANCYVGWNDMMLVYNYTKWSKQKVVNTAVKIVDNKLFPDL